MPTLEANLMIGKIRFVSSNIIYASNDISHLLMLSICISQPVTASSTSIVLDLASLDQLFARGGYNEVFCCDWLLSFSSCCAPSNHLTLYLPFKV